MGEEPLANEPPREPEDDDDDDFPEDMGSELTEVKVARPAARSKPKAEEKPPETILVRIRPYNKKRGQTKQSFGYQNYRFRVDQGWYRVPLDIGEYLRSVPVSDMDPDSPRAFDVCTDSEAQEILEREAEEAREGSVTKPRLP